MVGGAGRAGKPGRGFCGCGCFGAFGGFWGAGLGAGACTVTVCTCGAGAVFCGGCAGGASGSRSGSGSGESGALGAVVPKRVTGCGRDSGCQSLRADTVDSVVVAGALGCGLVSSSVLQPVRTRLAVTPVVAIDRNTTECRMRIPLEK